LAGTLAINSILTEVRFSSSNVQPNQIKSLKTEIDVDLARIKVLAFELQDLEIKQIVDSLTLTVESWETILADLSNAEIDRSLEIAEVELIGAVARSTELLESQLNLRIANEESAKNNQLRTAVIIGVVSLLFAIFGTVLLVPIAIAGSIERLVIMQKSNRDRERRLDTCYFKFS